MNRLTEVIGQALRQCGLEVREVEGSGQQIRELVVKNPKFPHWGRVVVDREGLLSWDYWGEMGSDEAAFALASVIIALIGSAPGEDGSRYPQPSTPAPPGDPGRAHP